MVIVAVPVVRAPCASADNLDRFGQDSTTHLNNGYFAGITRRNYMGLLEHHNCDIPNIRITIDYYKYRNYICVCMFSQKLIVFVYQL